MVNYLLYKTKDRFLSYSNQFMIYNYYDSTPIFRKLSIKFKNIEPSKELLNEIYKLGIISEQSSTSVRDVEISYAIQKDGLGIEKDQDNILELKNKHKKLSKLRDKLEWRWGKKNFMDYLLVAYKDGEIYALRNLE